MTALTKPGLYLHAICTCIAQLRSHILYSTRTNAHSGLPELYGQALSVPSIYHIFRYTDVAKQILCALPLLLKICFLCRVEEFDSEAMRVSLTLEQYIIPELLAWGVPSFEIKRLRY